MPPLVVSERSAVGDQILKIANLRSVDGGKVNFVDNPRRQRKPEPTRSGVSSANRVSVTARPPRFDAWLAKCFTIVGLRLHLCGPCVRPFLGGTARHRRRFRLAIIGSII